jgi:hypothetical protein
MTIEDRFLGFDKDWAMLFGGVFLAGFIAFLAYALSKRWSNEMTEFTDRILEILRSRPRGLTAKEVAQQLGATSSNISSRLSKLAAYGVLEKTRGKIACDVSVCAIYHAPSSASSTSYFAVTVGSSRIKVRHSALGF